MRRYGIKASETQTVGLMKFIFTNEERRKETRETKLKVD